MSCQGERRESRMRPAPGSSPHGRLRRGPDLPPLRESLRQCLPRRFAKTATHRMEALRLRFLRQAVSIRPMEAPCRSRNGSRRLPPGRCRPSLRMRREARILPMVGMSFDRLFLDRVGRHQSPSLLHRHAQTNTHLPRSGPKDDISALRRTRHFCFALTTQFGPLTPAPGGRMIWGGFQKGREDLT